MEIQKITLEIPVLQQKRKKLKKNASFLDVMNRFGDITEREIDENAIKSVPKNTEKGKNSVWI
jgi:pyruvate formate-lyase activating enzyme-like uncharacterized protein